MKTICYSCPKFLRQSFHEYAGESIEHSFWARAYYDGQRAKGKSHQAAVRSLTGDRAMNPLRRYPVVSSTASTTGS
jgi:hypothetical protein